MNKISLKSLKRIQGMSRNKILAVLPNIGHGGAFLPANFVKDGGAMAPYSDMAAPHVSRYCGRLDFRHRHDWLLFIYL
jgi:hypothetical protein